MAQVFVNKVPSEGSADKRMTVSNMSNERVKGYEVYYVAPDSKEWKTRQVEVRCWVCHKKR